MGQLFNKKYDDRTLYRGPEYKSWDSMKQRCTNPKTPQYRDYGGRGIEICERWANKKTGFLNFYKDMGKKTTAKHTIERINNDGDYEPKNCRWATRSEQMFNQRMRRDNTSGYRGITFVRTINRWRPEIQYQGARITVRSFDSPEEAYHIYKDTLLQLQDN